MPGRRRRAAGSFPSSQVRRGMTGTAWTVFSGSKPEAMEVEILGVLRGARGPGQDMILAQLHGAKPEYTGVVAGMSGSPVYIGNRLLGALSYRIGQFSKDPIAGITPIEQMLEVRDLPMRDGTGTRSAEEAPALCRQIPSEHGYARRRCAEMNFQTMETPLVMSGFRPEAIRLWQQQMAGTGLERWPPAEWAAVSASRRRCEPFGRGRGRACEPGSAVSAQLVRGDLEISATCTVTYIDPKQLLACGHPDSAGRAGFAAHDHGRCGGHAGLAAERFQDHQYRRHHRRLYRGSRRGHSRGPGRAGAA